MESALVIWFEDLAKSDVPRVGGKNASLGEMIQNLGAEGVRVPPGFATTADAYRRFVAANTLDAVIRAQIEAYRKGRISLQDAGREIRAHFLRADFPAELTAAITEAYGALSARCGKEEVDVAVRSSATAEDLPNASFAGQQETFLNISGVRDLLDACRRCMASLFTDRAIAYRDNQGFDHLEVALSIGVQQMVRSDRAGSGVMFSLDTDTGCPDVVLVTAAWGLGETVVQGVVDPDEHMVFKPLLDDASKRPIISRNKGEKAVKMVYATGGSKATQTVRTTRQEREAFVLDDDEVLHLARWAVTIERHYGVAMDMEWAKDGDTGELFIVQARPETVQSRKGAAALRTHRLTAKGPRLLTGLAIGDAVAMGEVCRIDSPAQIDRFRDGAVLVTGNTDPDWVPIMKRAAAIVTDHGGRTSHAAIVSRELGLPAIVGTGTATRTLRDGQAVTVSCAEGETGAIYEGIGEVEVTETDIDALPKTRTKVMLNMGNPAAAMRWWRLPADGVGLARMEFIIGNWIKVHPLALTRYDALEDEAARRTIDQLARGYADRTEYFVDQLALGIGRIAAARSPHPVIVRMSDFKTNEYANLIGGRQFEPVEENPMLGFRGASRYDSDRYRDGFALECRALRRVREEMGFTNVVVMIPFCRTLDEADRVLAVMAENGLERGRAGLEVYVMCEIPSNVILAEQFAERFDGFSIGSNDLTQLVLGVDRDSDILSAQFDESNEAVKTMIREVIARAHRSGRKVGLCGQAPSDNPAFARFLVEAGIDSISVSADSFAAVKRQVAEAEAEGA